MIKLFMAFLKYQLNNTINIFFSTFRIYDEFVSYTYSYLYYFLHDLKFHILFPGQAHPYGPDPMGWDNQMAYMRGG